MIYIEKVLLSKEQFCSKIKLNLKANLKPILKVTESAFYKD